MEKQPREEQQLQMWPDDFVCSKIIRDLGSVTDCRKCTYKDKCSNHRENQQHLDGPCRKRKRLNAYSRRDQERGVRRIQIGRPGFGRGYGGKLRPTTTRKKTPHTVWRKLAPTARCADDCATMKRPRRSVKHRTAEYSGTWAFPSRHGGGQRKMAGECARKQERGKTWTRETEEDIF